MNRRRRRVATGGQGDKNTGDVGERERVTVEKKRPQKRMEGRERKRSRHGREKIEKEGEEKGGEREGE